MTQTGIASISPFFIVRNVSAALSFYCGMRGFTIVHQEPEAAPFLQLCSAMGR
jgi:catechol 2,3-dioxygenase-like lactoylglutathione lyase family enzyme